ncbi:hypothetical protein, partial [Dubosiella newyorkensis]|uniref:hypothetical protein n=1 Tax=Dubosiella newyorkensis TaxID=1862672 RepID=UPI00272AC7A7
NSELITKKTIYTKILTLPILLPFSDGHLMIKKGCLSCVGLFRFDDDDPEAELERIQEEETKDSDLIQGFFYGPRS